MSDRILISSYRALVVDPDQNLKGVEYVYFDVDAGQSLLARLPFAIGPSAFLLWLEDRRALIEAAARPQT